MQASNHWTVMRMDRDLGWFGLQRMFSWMNSNGVVLSCCSFKKKVRHMLPTLDQWGKPRFHMDTRRRRYQITRGPSPGFEWS